MDKIQMESQKGRLWASPWKSMWMSKQNLRTHGNECAMDFAALWPPNPQQPQSKDCAILPHCFGGNQACWGRDGAEHFSSPRARSNESTRHACFSPFLLRLQALGWCPFRLTLSPGLLLSGNAPWHIQKHAFVSSVTLNPLNLALKIKQPIMKEWELQGHAQCLHPRGVGAGVTWGYDLFLAVTGAN